MDVRRLAAVRCWLRADVLPAAVTATVLLASTAGKHDDWSEGTQRVDSVGYLMLAAAAAAVLLHRRKPTVMLAVETVLAGGYLVAGYFHNPPPILLPVAFAAFAVGRRRPPSPAAVAAGAAGAGIVGTELIREALYGDRSAGWAPWAIAVLQVVWVAVPALVGGLIQVAHRSAARAAEEAQRASVEQERLRLSREVHDVVGHGLSVISLQAGVALHVFDRRPDQARAALEAIRRTSQDALEELRAMFALTHAEAGQDSPESGTTAHIPHPEDTHRAADTRRAPLTGLARLDAMLAEVRRCGVPVELVICGSGPNSLPADVDLTAFRVVQESLTNVLRHAGPSRARVDIRYEPDRLEVEVSDEPTVPAPTVSTPTVSSPTSGTATHLGPGGARAGVGLRGLRERAVDLGGTVVAGTRPDGGWQVRAVLPLQGRRRRDAGSEAAQRCESGAVITTSDSHPSLDAGR